MTCRCGNRPELTVDGDFVHGFTGFLKCQCGRGMRGTTSFTRNGAIKAVKDTWRFMV